MGACCSTSAPAEAPPSASAPPTAAPSKTQEVVPEKSDEEPEIALPVFNKPPGGGKTENATHGVKAKLTGPDEAKIGSTISVGWQGPDNAHDFVGISKAGTKGYINYCYTGRGGNPLDLLMPTEPGQYEIKYTMEENNDKVLASKSIKLIESPATVECQSTAIIGSTIEVAYEGPENDRDFIAVARKPDGNNNSAYINYTYVGGVGENNPLKLLLPTEPGTYEIKYMMEQNNACLLYTSPSPRD